MGISGRVASAISSSLSSTVPIYTDGLVTLYSLVKLSPLKYLPMDSAANFPAAIASITVLGPETTSPPANTPFLSVASVSSSISIVPQREILIPSFSAKKPVSGCSLIAGISVSNSIVNSEPSIGTGLLLPLLSISPSSI